MGMGTQYKCVEFIPSFQQANSHNDVLMIDGIPINLKGIEALDQMKVVVGDISTAKKEHTWNVMPVRLLTAPIQEGEAAMTSALHLFRGTSGILGASGKSLGCRNQTMWDSLLGELQVKLVSLDFQPPAESIFAGSSSKSSGIARVVFDHLDREVTWSEPKQTGDNVNDGMNEFLIYHPKVCGVDLLYNTSSNWLTVIDTSGPCLSLPPFLFDRLMTHIPVKCPFTIGQSSDGKLCAPRREGTLLPALYFALADEGMPKPRQLSLPLERLVYKNDGQELLCIARSNSENVEPVRANMMTSHIAFGSLAVAAFYTVINRENNTIGLASQASDIAAESTDAFCAKAAVCQSQMQTYYPPLNVCLDPDCAGYLFMTLDEETKTCRWSSFAPVLLVTTLVGLALLDLAVHRLYGQTIEKASEFGQ
jgi:hypothetical protein